MRYLMLILASIVFAAATTACDAGAFPMPSMPDLQGARPEATVEVARGVRCEFAGSEPSTAFADAKVTFTCQSTENTEVGLVGDIRSSDAGWTMERMTLTKDETGTAVTDSDIVVISQVELADGTTCSYAGAGAQEFDGKRLGFRCDSPMETGLLGQVTVADGEWTVEQAFLGHGADGLMIQSTQPAPIAALLVFSSD